MRPMATPSMATYLVAVLVTSPMLQENGTAKQEL